MTNKDEKLILERLQEKEDDDKIQTLQNLQFAINKNINLVNFIRRINLQYIDEETGEVIDKQTIDSLLPKSKTMEQEKTEETNFNKPDEFSGNKNISNKMKKIDIIKEISFVGIYEGYGKLPNAKFDSYVLFFSKDGNKFYMSAWSQLFAYFKQAERNKEYAIHYEGVKQNKNGENYYLCKIFKNMLR
jgi:hypothetical protein